MSAALITTLIILEFPNDLFEGIVLAALFVCVASLWWYTFRYPKSWRWVDIASGFYPRGQLWPVTSDAQLIEEQITDRERRLSQLKTAGRPRT